MALIPPVTRLTSSIIRILGCNPSVMTLQGTNTYLLGNGKKRILIDTGDEDVPQYIEHLNDVLRKEQASIATIILTHWHHDHVGGVKDIVGSSLADNDCQVFKFRRTDASDACPEIPTHIQLQPLSNNQEFSVEGANMRVVHTPGHTTDHITIAMDEGTLFSGDCILGEGTAVFEDLYEYMKSLDTILKIQPLRIFPGHGNVIDEPVPKIEYYINHRNNREQQIFQFFTQRPNERWQSMDVVREVYKETPEELWPAAAYNVSHHLQKLQKESKLVLKELDEEQFYVYNPKSLL
ncbi:beta-lactamase-like protein 2 homolog [Drosophila guanche]|uniref:Beta-lactamase-like protein 2 homolog n=1 Tax=Drosophila guanche TaxID=7266 RepID=A0A3B0KR91_DROGU|nr:beta-lactamase-like protein 2 homolog [Drosophila guanche]XP_034135291.1 beta-lactamase-like protein 2 homolog [Drosophila guanche]SPP86428.1 blast:Beta-lactamase-like protein 2 homolog [Drosophila guanche]